MIRLWRRFMAWLNEPDEVTMFVTFPHQQHCPLCEAHHEKHYRHAGARQ